jgi:hypothetical protein
VPPYSPQQTLPQPTHLEALFCQGHNGEATLTNSARCVEAVQASRVGGVDGAGVINVCVGQRATVVLWLREGSCAQG